MRRAFAAVTLLALGALATASEPAWNAAGGDVVAIDARGFRVGALVWRWGVRDRSVNLRDFVRALGPPSSCRLGRSRADAKAVWMRRGIRGDFTTLGAFPRSRDTACTAPAYVHPDNVEVFRHTWRTDRGLHVGATLTRLRVLYPTATRHRDGWWLVTRRNDPLFGTYGQLVAGVRAGRVTFLRLVLHAQGD